MSTAPPRNPESPSAFAPDEAELAADEVLPADSADKSFRSWPAPAGVRASPGGVEAGFRALGFGVVVDEGPGWPEGKDGELPPAVRFEAWRRPRLTGAVLAGALGAASYLLLKANGAGEFLAVVIVVLEAWFVPMALLPSYTVSGRIQRGRVVLRLRAKGLLARPARLERRLRFYLERTPLEGAAAASAAQPAGR